MAIDLVFKLEEYKCVPCSSKQGTLVRELVRMIPACVIIDGAPVGDEYWCCPVCYEPKFGATKATRDRLSRLKREKTSLKPVALDI